MGKEKKKGIKKVFAIIGIAIGGVLATVLTLAVGLVAFLSITEYKPGELDEIAVNNNQSNKVSLNQNYSLFSWNVGYCALDENSDFFMDGGSMVRANSKQQVENNAKEISDATTSQNVDFVFYQEVDEDSSRSKRVNEVNIFSSKFSNFGYTYCYNYKTEYVPYPLPTLGKVSSGLLTLSKYQIKEAHRKKLPSTFSWPVSLVNLKRCLNITRLPINGSSKELVLINLHLEAYDEGDAKIAQTKVLLDVLKEEEQKGNYVIAGGDFNQTFSSVDMNKYPVKDNNWVPGFVDEEELTNINYTPLVDDSVPSCRLLDHPYKGTKKSDNQYYVIDALIVSNNVTVNDSHLVDYDFKNSDHNPFYLNFKLI